jgi:hypothetical protein
MEKNNQTTELELKALEYPEQAKAVKVIDSISLVQANEFLRAVKALRLQIADAWDPVIESAHKAHKQALEQKKRYEEPLVQAERIVRAEMSRYMAEQERARREAEEKARREREEAERKRLEALRAAAAADQAGNTEEADRILEEIPEKPRAVIPEAPKVQGASLRRNLRWRVVDINLVPREYLEINRAEIEKIFRALREKMAIPGIEIYEETTLVMRDSDA